MDQMLLGAAVSTWIIAAAVFAAVILGVPVIRAGIRRRCPGTEPSNRSWRTLAARLNDRWMRLSTLTIAAVLAALTLDPPAHVLVFAKTALIAMLTVQIIGLVPALVDWLLLRISQSNAQGPASAAAETLSGMRWLVLFVTYALILLLALQNLGVNVTSLIAGLGIGGIAVALALQSILGDLFASLTIALDKPFVLGDFIVVGTEMGTVEHIGLKTTRVRSLSGEQLVFGNADLLASRIRNYKRMSERRVAFGFGVVYHTPPQTLESINAIVRRAIESQSNVRFDRCHFFRFGNSSLDFEAVYYINSPDYNAHMDAQQSVHLSIIRAFREQGIEFAFPSQTVYVAGHATPPQLAATRPNDRLPEPNDATSLRPKPI